MRNILLFLITIQNWYYQEVDIKYNAINCNKTSLPIGQVSYKVQEEKLIEIKEVPMD